MGTVIFLAIVYFILTQAPAFAARLFVMIAWTFGVVTLASFFVSFPEGTERILWFAWCEKTIWITIGTFCVSFILFGCNRDIGRPN
jgi:hypothetical protein